MHRSQFHMKKNTELPFYIRSFNISFIRFQSSSSCSQATDKIPIAGECRRKK